MKKIKKIIAFTVILIMFVSSSNAAGDITLKDLNVIVLTANAMAGDEEKYIDAGCNDYISKPIDKEKFQQEITACLEN